MSKTQLRRSLEKAVFDVVEKNNKLSQENRLEFYNKFDSKLVALYEVVKELDADHFATSHRPVGHECSLLLDTAEVGRVARERDGSMHSRR